MKYFTIFKNPLTNQASYEAIGDPIELACIALNIFRVYQPIAIHKIPGF